MLWPGAAAAQGRRGASAEALAAARRFLCPNGGVPQGRGRCAPSRGGGGGGGGADPDVRGWDQGIAPPSRAQRPCPEGTRADAARFNPGVTRCIPS
ncbi:hypothetical protein ACI6QG_00515 [Roseococcus sp. DSY-14]|uniref:hypothetical protein n=1 Tax=Roseococcus sp. DSY-14 TaxID=3369650 RepID=UPI00387B8451